MHRHHKRDFIVYSGMDKKKLLFCAGVVVLSYKLHGETNTFDLLQNAPACDFFRFNTTRTTPTRSQQQLVFLLVPIQNVWHY